jgi:hypothetical protein
MAAYTGPINYITMVEALKKGPPHHHPAADLHEQQHEAAAAVQEVPEQEKTRKKRDGSPPFRRAEQQAQHNNNHDAGDGLAINCSEAASEPFKATGWVDLSSGYRFLPLLVTKITGRMPQTKRQLPRKK